MKKAFLFIGILTLTLSIGVGGCKKDDPKVEVEAETPAPGTSDKKYVLVIDNGAQAMEVGQTTSLKAHLVSSTGEVITPANVSWSSDIGGITGNVFALTKVSVGIITATAEHEGQTYKASVPVNVQDAKENQLFAVVPSAVIWSTNSGDIQLHTIYMGNESSSFSFESTNTNIVTVSSAGFISFKAAGSANIKVTGKIAGKEFIQVVPVMVVGMPEIPLPVTRIVVNPAVGEMFKGETLKLDVKAFNSKNEDVTSTVTFAYAVEAKKEDDFEPAVPITVSNSGEVKATNIGAAYVKVSANGIMGQAEIMVNPDTIIMVTPFNVSLGGMDISDPMNPKPGASEVTLTAKMKKVDRVKYRAKDYGFLVDVANPANLTWELPLTGIAEIDEMFKCVTLSEKTNSSVKVTKVPGKAGSTVVVAHSGIYGGGASILVTP